MLLPADEHSGSEEKVQRRRPLQPLSLHQGSAVVPSSASAAVSRGAGAVVQGQRRRGRRDGAPQPAVRESRIGAVALPGCICEADAGAGSVKHSAVTEVVRVNARVPCNHRECAKCKAASEPVSCDLAHNDRGGVRCVA